MSFYYCFDAAGERLQTVVAEVHNTPWGERHCYVLAPGNGGGPDRRGHYRYRTAKELHVSPFIDMDLEHEWETSVPGERLFFRIADHRSGRQIFAATLTLERREISGRSFASVLLRYPLIIAPRTDLRLFHLDDITPHYARTLAAWHRRFLNHRDAVTALGFPESFQRLWEFYFCYCEGGFLERTIGDVQLLLTKPRNRRQPLEAPA